VISSVVPAFALSYSTGLIQGDTASYTLYHKTDTFGSQLKVLAVSGTKVTVNIQDYPSFGVVLGNMWLDIFSGQTNSSVPSLFFAVGSGLNKGDPVFDGSSMSMSDQRSYACGAGGQTRPQVYTAFQSSGESVQISWDQSTGIMCNYQANYSNGTIALGFALVSTSLWGSSGANPNTDPFVLGGELSGVLGLVLLVLVVFVYFRRKRSKARDRVK
jgi:hypothetical protein